MLPISLWVPSPYQLMSCVKKREKKLLLVSVYGPTHDENKEDFLTEVSQLCAKRDCPMIMGGDFNILRYSSKKIKHSLLISTQTSLTR